MRGKGLKTLVEIKWMKEKGLKTLEFEWMSVKGIKWLGLKILGIEIWG